MNGSGLIRNLLLAVVDLLTIAFAWIVSLVAYDIFGSGQYEYSFYLHLWPVAVGFVVLNSLFRLYHGRFVHPAVPVPPVEEFRRLVGAALMTHLGLVAVIAISRQTTVDYSRAVMVIAGILTAVLAQPFRDLARRVMFRTGFGLIPVHLVGDGPHADVQRRNLAQDIYTGFKVVPEDVPAGIAVTCVDPRVLKCRMGALLDRYAHLAYIPTDGTYPISGAHLFQIGGFGGIEMVNQRRMGVLRIEKWCLDKFLALVTFVVLSPLFVIVPLLVKATSRGPVFYRQRRLGRDGSPIHVWKFRSMYADADERLARILATDENAAAEWAAEHKLAKDPRTTPLGRFLRRTSIDELPQLFNVFAGDMALVGPRPIVDEEVAFYGKAYSVMSSVKPGITGLWQVSGRSDTDYAQRVALDTHYVLNWSLWLDVWVLMRTIGAVVFMRGAR